AAAGGRAERGAVRGPGDDPLALAPGAEPAEADAAPPPAARGVLLGRHLPPGDRTRLRESRGSGMDAAPAPARRGDPPAAGVRGGTRPGHPRPLDGVH